ncbi:hypothetical protein [Chryseobacterium angstadtii]|uniref:hypothetical protein n=1 Tax=Chryseobacterium angstadtii TaxID=558151 RepID=UPI001F4C84B4|nr:hypothetical protein [Chryseobacterium angstadtii]
MIPLLPVSNSNETEGLVTEPFPMATYPETATVPNKNMSILNVFIVLNDYTIKDMFGY